MEIYLEFEAKNFEDSTGNIPLYNPVYRWTVLHGEDDRSTKKAGWEKAYRLKFLAR